jgi:endonuclease/exonuclease/phosphatase family metal-dependent hydrolase
MNFGPRSRAYRRLAAELRDVQLARPRRPIATFPTRWPVARIDHVFVKGNVEAVAVDAARTRLAYVASDHFPLVAELRIGAPTRMR